uniref:Major capsid protein n=1 Tax=Ranid herpesvirus 4 TaxID=2849006 RepID=A0A8F3CIH1_9VIRU|nr:MAG: hypothetical protein [Ranid herpesvirus 4]
MNHALAFAGNVGPLAYNFTQPANAFNVVQWNNELRQLFNLTDLSAEQFTRLILKQYAESTPEATSHGSRSAGLNNLNFCKEIVIPFLVVHYGGLLNPRTQSNYNACQLLALPIAPKQAPAGELKFKYVISSRSLSLAQHGDGNEHQGENRSSFMTFDASLKRFAHTIYIPSVELFHRIDALQIYTEMCKLVRENRMAWEFRIAMLHYEYARRQPSYTTLLLNKKSNSDNLMVRTGAGMILDIITLDNMMHGCLNRDFNLFGRLLNSAIGMQPEIENVVAIMPKGLLAEMSGLGMVKITIKNRSVYSFSVSDMDDRHQKLNVDWSHDLLKSTNTGDLDSRFEITWVQEKYPRNISYKVLKEENTKDCFFLPAFKIGDTVVPCIQLDDQPIHENGPSMQTDYVSSGQKRYFFTVGTVPKIYNSFYKLSAFYKDTLDFTTGKVAVRNPGFSYVINLEEEGTPIEISTAMLHQYANCDEVFRCEDFAMRVEQIPICSAAEYIGAYCKTFAQPIESRTKEQVICSEISPRNMLSVRYTTNGTGVQASYAKQPRLCLWNSFLMSAPEGEYAALTGLYACLGENKQLDEFLKFVRAAAATVTPEAVSTLVFMRMLAQRIDTQQDFNDMMNDAQMLESIGRLFNAISVSGGNAVYFADPICQLFMERLIRYLETSVQNGQFVQVVPVNVFDRLVELRARLVSGINAFRAFIKTIPVPMIHETLLPFSLSTYHFPKEDHNYIRLFSNIALPGMVNREIRYFYVNTACGPTKRKKKPDSPPTDEQTTTHVKLFEKIYSGEHYAMANPNTRDYVIFNSLTGKIDQDLNNGDMHSTQMETRTYSHTFYCYSDKPDLAYALSCGVTQLGNYNLGLFLGDRMILQRAADNNFTLTGVNAGENRDYTHLAFADISKQRINMKLTNVHTVYANTIQQQYTPFYSTLQPSLVLRLRQLRKILAELPLHATLMCAHYFGTISQRNLTKYFDQTYYSGWAYLCVRTMTYKAYDMAVMPVGDAIFATGNRTVHLEKDTESIKFITKMDMGMLLGRHGNSGVVFPGVHIKEMAGMNVVFSEENKRGDYTLAVDRATAQEKNFTLVLDWSNFLLPSTNSGARSCHSTIPLNGRFVNVTNLPRSQARGPGGVPLLTYLKEVDPVLNTYCVCPTLLNLSDSIVNLKTIASNCLTNANPAEAFIKASSYANVDKTIPHQSFDFVRREKLLAHAMSNIKIAPFTNLLGLMFADTYTIGRGATQYLKESYSDQIARDLNPRVEGEGLTPCHYFNPETSHAYFMSKFTSVTNFNITSNITLSHQYIDQLGGL